MDKPGPITHWTYPALRFVSQSIIISRCDTKKRGANHLIRPSEITPYTIFLFPTPVSLAKFTSKICIIGTHIEVTMAA